MKPFFKAVTFLFCFIIIISCNNNPTDPELQPGRRDYVWTVDTLNMPMNLIGTIWGSSPTDVWTTGAGGDDLDRLQHFDGSRWSAYTKEPIYCTGNTLFGFSANNVWMGGNNDGRIWHYNGIKWSENFRYKVEGAYNVSINNIWGTQSNDIYACGTISFYNKINEIWRGFVLHYNGVTWVEVTQASFNSQFFAIRKEQNQTFVFALRTSQTVNDTVAFYKLNGTQLKEIYSNPNKYMGSIRVLGGKLFFSIDEDVFRYIDGTFVKQFSLTSPNFGYQFYGRNEKDVFIRMKDGLAHYNGIDIQYMYNWPLYMVSIINEPAIFEKEVFFCLWDATHVKNMILHGKLKE